MVKIDKVALLKKVIDDDCLPSPSPLLVELLELAADEHSSLADLSRVIEQDSGFVTRLLKIANSAFYARRKKVASVSQAILMLGFNRVRSIALSLSLRDCFPLGRQGNMDYEYFWKTSLYRALIAQGFARCTPTLQRLNDEEVFTAGLIQEIGLLMLYHVCPEELKDAFPCGDVPLADVIAWQQEHFSINHRLVARMVLGRWNFPEKILETQKYFGADALREDRSLLCRLLEFAGAATEIFFGQRDDFHFISETAPKLGLEMDEVNAILSTTFLKVEEIAQELHLKVNSNREVLAVMEKANQALVKINGSLQANIANILGLIVEQGVSDGVRTEEDYQENEPDFEDLLTQVAEEIQDALMAIGGFAQKLARDAAIREDVMRYVGAIVQGTSGLREVLNQIAVLTRENESFLSRNSLIEPLEAAIYQLQFLLELRN